MTVDVEDYYQVSAFESHVEKSQWASMPSRVEANVEKILQLFDDAEVKGTFFTLGCVANSHPSMVRKIVAQGHELASHGWEHIRVTQQDRGAFREDISRTRSLLEDISGTAVLGYRAASYSIGADNLWALDELAEAGYQYSSSIVPIHHDHYGMPDAPRFAFPAAGGRLLEIPISTLSIAGRNFNCGGGGWFRLYPYAFSRWALKRLNTGESQSGIFYFHPWEIDADQPRISGLGLKTRFRHYLNLGRMHSRVKSLLSDFEWDRVDRVFPVNEYGQ
ncbi:DUF3473 domain-containing protein [Parahaliea sp. F7430]|uniref:DUF3473 domain-containing protein n=2 Tax=Sediminihaliea albiluteola TaxID=2758564 RepID=A0A7W2TVG6_9GAMM|nr:DUF3473 domain-containing protein [Sediminihaliea albiluteola]